MCATRIVAVFFVVSALLASAQAKGKPSYSRGILAEMQSVSCGSMQKSGPTVAGALITGAEHSKSHELLCQEYTLKTDRVTYRIRPKDEKHPELLPVGEEAEFRLKKDEMLLRIPESDSKEREYIVVSMAPTTEFATEIESTRRPPKPHGRELKVEESETTAAGPPSSAHASAQVMAVPVASAAVPAAAAKVNSVSSGELQVESAPAGAEIYVDSAIAGRTPALLTLKSGQHSIQVVMAGYKDWVTNVNVSPGVQQQVSANLSR